uniref:Uncharacterized protein n=1 Tax=viral metagenome TaxID=1070528 RepID=A0A6C0JE63_9ZZZZ
MNVKRLLDTTIGRFCISAILGLGLASLFNKVCKDRNCLVFNGPILSEFDGKIYKYDNKCYKYSLTPSKCDSHKRIVDVSDPNESNTKQNGFF